MNLKKKTTLELHNLSKAVKAELYKRSTEHKELIKSIKAKKIQVFKYAKSLITFIEKKEGVLLRTQNRKASIIDLRFAIMTHLRSKDMSLKQIALVFNRDHSSVISALNRGKDRYDTKDVYYLIAHDKINALISEFNKIDSNN